jgi:5'-methylthioadenosine phosphorylase
VHEGDGFVFLRRHGEVGYRPPHRIPHHAHVLAFEMLGVRRAAGLASTGALRGSLRPGQVIVPDDYISWQPPPTFAADEYLHIVPALDPAVRDLLIRAARDAAGDSATAPAVTDGGVYVETRGPRFETAAEVRMLAQYADVVGMTVASEATLMQERGIAYAVLCIVDNYANGIGPTPLTLDAFRAQLARNADLAREILARIIRTCTEK